MFDVASSTGTALRRACNSSVPNSLFAVNQIVVYTLRDGRCSGTTSPDGIPVVFSANADIIVGRELSIINVQCITLVTKFDTCDNIEVKGQGHVVMGQAYLV